MPIDTEGLTKCMVSNGRLGCILRSNSSPQRRYFIPPFPLPPPNGKVVLPQSKDFDETIVKMTTKDRLTQSRMNVTVLDWYDLAIMLIQRQNLLKLKVKYPFTPSVISRNPFQRKLACPKIYTSKFLTLKFHFLQKKIKNINTY